MLCGLGSNPQAEYGGQGITNTSGNAFGGGGFEKFGASFISKTSVNLFQLIYFSQLILTFFTTEGVHFVCNLYFTTLVIEGVISKFYFTECVMICKREARRSHQEQPKPTPVPEIARCPTVSPEAFRSVSAIGSGDGMRWVIMGPRRQIFGGGAPRALPRKSVFVESHAYSGPVERPSR